MTYIDFNIPKGMAIGDVAECMTAYLLGGGSFNNGRRNHGPFIGEDKIQLDGSNDYWLHTTEIGQARLSWRYAGQADVAYAMLALFKARHCKRELCAAPTA
jgi:hypothetical protein